MARFAAGLVVGIIMTAGLVWARLVRWFLKGT